MFRRSQDASPLGRLEANWPTGNWHLINKRWDTSAMIKSHLYCFSAKRNGMMRNLNLQIVLPLAPTSKAPGCAVQVIILVAEQRPTSALVSTRKRPPEILSCTKSRSSLRLDAMAPTDSQSVCLLIIPTVVGTCKPFYQTCDGNSKDWRLLGAVSFLASIVVTGQR